MRQSLIALSGVFLLFLTPGAAYCQSPNELRRLEEMDRVCANAREEKIRQVQRQKIDACVKEPPEYRAAPKSREDCERYWKDYGRVQSNKSTGTRPHLYTDLPACRRAADARKKFEGR